MSDKQTEHPNIEGISAAITDLGLASLLSGGPTEEVQAYAVIAQWLATLGQAIATEDWDIAKGLADGSLSSDEAAHHFGWI